MPTPVISQPMRVAPALALAAMFCGSEKIPPPTMEPTTSAISAPRRSLLVESDMLFPLGRGRCCYGTPQREGEC